MVMGRGDGFFYIVVGILDYSFQYYKIRKDLKMSKDDVKQEHKDLEGDLK